MTNCPNCGAPIDPFHTKCEYCGTYYFDMTVFDINKPFYIKIDTGNEILTALVKTNSINIEALSDDAYYYDSGVHIHYIMPSPRKYSARLELDLDFLSDNEGLVCKIERKSGV